jgi:predicted alpha/beta superfamily hydrolase
MSWQSTQTFLRWQSYQTLKQGIHHTVTGDVRLLSAVYSPELDNCREILVYLPPGYWGSLAHYPVIYMHDGQNLFDAATSFAGEWEVDETLDQLSEEGIEAIVVGIPNLGPERPHEYSPFVDRIYGGGHGDQYINFIADTLKPLIDDAFRTRPGREQTAIFGSSLGGLISLYGFFHRPDTFGMVGAMSPSLGFAGEAIFPYIRCVQYTPGRIYIDSGTAEVRRPQWAELPILSRLFKSQTLRLARQLIKKGYTPNTEIHLVEEDGGKHNEVAWRRRFPNAIRFLLQDL